MDYIEKKEVNQWGNVKFNYFERVKSILQLMRVHQWIKNIFIFAGVAITMSSINALLILKTFATFFLFCGISSTIYIINDIVDIDKDRMHPRKKYRPLASGVIRVKHAIIGAIILGPTIVILSFLLNTRFGFIITIYLLLNLAYSLKLKNYVIIDIFIITTGFVLRIISGMLITDGEISFWFLLCMALLFLYLGFNKRKKELLLLVDHSKEHRKNLGEYTVGFIDEINPMLTASSIISYSLFVIYDQLNLYLIVTIPMFLFGVLRYQYLLGSMNYGENPELVLLKDKSMIVITILCGLCYIINIGF